jgi:hypothetical protein
LTGAAVRCDPLLVELLDGVQVALLLAPYLVLIVVERAKGVVGVSGRFQCPNQRNDKHASDEKHQRIFPQQLVDVVGEFATPLP